MQVSDETIAGVVARYSSFGDRGILGHLLAFGRVLKEVGIPVSLSQVIDASRSLALVDISREADFRAVLRSNLVSHKDDMLLFDRAFDSFWRTRTIEGLQHDEMEGPQTSTKDDVGSAGSKKMTAETVKSVSGADGLEEADEELPVPSYSPHDSLAKKDFREMGVEERRAITRAILLIARKIATQVSRRKRRTCKRGEIDPRWTFRRNMKYGGDIIQLAARKRRIKKTRIVLLCDVSGSMDCYSRFLIQFMYGMQNELWGVETFVFSTFLSRITQLIRSRNLTIDLERISNSVSGWSGGTNIGRSLQMFNRDFAPRLVTHRTVVLIISDGWDRGEISLLEDEMKKLKRRCHKIIWLNPLLGNEDYEPLCRGMHAALPYLDFFLAVHNLHSLTILGRTLQKLAA